MRYQNARVGTSADLIDIAENDLFHGVVLEDLANNSAVASADDENLFRVGMGGKREMSNHLLVSGTMSI